MGKRTEDEIRQKLVELEVAMKQEQAVQAAEDAIIVEDDGEEDTVTTAVSRIEQDIKAKEKKVKKAAAKAAARSGVLAKADAGVADLYQLGGIASLVAGFIIMLSHIRVGVTWGAFAGAGGLVLLPLFVGIGMLIYNYKSRIAQIVTVTSLAVVIFGVFSHLTLGFFGLSLLDLIILALPIVVGCVLLAKANVKRREARESIKLIQ